MHATALKRGWSARVRHTCRALLEPMEVRRLLANVVVNTLADETMANSTTSLREAVVKANPGDTIVFQSGLSGEITLGGSQIVIGKNLRIDGPNGTTPSITVSGNNASRIFQISSGVTVNIDDLRIQEGRAQTGGGIHNSGTLNLTNVQLTVNTAEGPGGDEADPNGRDGSGGAIYNTGKLTLTGGAILNNTAAGGEGAFSDSSPTRYGAGGDGLGGGIYSTEAGQMTITSTRFTNNLARGGHGLVFTQGGRGGNAYGGAIYAAGNLAITGATLNLNAANAGSAGDGDFDSDIGGDAFGGAIWAGNSLAITNSTLNQNSATGGAGGFGNDLLAGYDSGSGSGGAIFADSANTTIAGSTLNNNTAAGAPADRGGGSGTGGAVNAYLGSVTVTNSTFHSNHAIGTESFAHSVGGFASGGAIAASGTLNVTGSTFALNTAVAGKGASADASRGRQIPGFDGGDARGGAIYTGNAAASITRSTIFGNTIQGGEGGPGYDDVTWPAGDGGDARGGGVFATGALTLTANTIAGNSATAGGHDQSSGVAVDGTAAGGGVSVGTSLNIANTIVATNTAGGAPDVSGTATSQGFNLIGKTNGSSGWLASDKKGTAATPLNPLLGPLASNGGPTQTMLPQPGSPAIDAGKAFGLTTDQRGLPRTANQPSVPNASGGDGTDIGSVEIQVSPSQTPFKNHNLGPTPVTIQNEDFDNGGEGVAYHDTESANRGGSNYRGATGVDLQAVQNDSGSVAVGYTKAGEWLEYTVNVQTAGTYSVAFRLASAVAGGKFHLEVDGADKTGQLTVPATLGWQTWTTITKTGVALPAGTHVLRLKMDANGATGYVGNFNYMTITRTATAATITTDTAAHVRDGIHSNTNYGNTATLEVKKSTTSYNREAYLKFNLASVASISNAKLRIFGGLDVAGSIQLGVYGSSNIGWSESGITWNNRNPGATTASALATATVSGTTAKWYELDVTSYLKAEKLAGRNTVTLVLKSSTNTTALATFAADGAVNAPQLIVTS